jgi:hypothetical protein
MPGPYPPWSGDRANEHSGRAEHAALLRASEGYRSFVDEFEPDPEDGERELHGFAAWIMLYPAQAEKYSDWDTQRWWAKWNYWNS